MAKIKTQTRKFELLVLNPGKGLNSMISDSLIKDEESSSLLNIEFVESGCPTKRKGTQQVGDTVGTRIRGIGNLYTAAGTKLLLAVMGTTLRKLVTGTWTTITGVTLTNDKDMNFVQCRNAVYGHNGTDNMICFDGTTLSQPATAALPTKFGIYYKGYHIASGSAAFPSRLYLSNPKNASDFTGSTGTASSGAAASLTDSTKAWGVNDFQDLTIVITGGTGTGHSRTISANTATVISVSTNWATNPDNTSTYQISSGNWVDLQKDDGDQITGLGKFGENLVVFKERSTWQMAFDSTFKPVFTCVNSAIGCVSHRSVENVENDLFFLSRDGVYVLGNEPNYFNVIRTNELSARIHPTLEGISSSNLGMCAAIYDNYTYRLAIPYGGSTYNNYEVAYDRRYQAWTVKTGMKINSWTIFIDSSNEKHLYYADDNAGEVREVLTQYVDDSTAIDAYWVSKNFDLGAFDRKKQWKDITLWFRNAIGTVSITITIDGTTITRNVTLGSSQTGSYGIGTDWLAETLLGQDGGGAYSADIISQSEPIRIKVNKPGRTLKIKVANNVAGEYFTLLGFGITGKIKSHSNFPSAYKY